MSRLPEVMLLDLDDTILSYHETGERCWDQLCADYAPRLGITPQALLSAMKQVGVWYWSDPLRHRQGRLNLRAARREIIRLTFENLSLTGSGPLGDELADTFTVLREEMAEPFPGALEAVRAFRRTGVRLGLLTNGNAEFQRQKIDRFGLDRLFEIILIESEFGVGKPDPRIFRHALSALGAVPGSTWMVGNDLEFDIHPALSLGLTAVWVDVARAGLPSGSPVSPTRTILNLADLLE